MIHKNLFFAEERYKELVDYLAFSAHQNWCDGLRKSGWNYGRAFNSKKKMDPYLVAYEDLKEHEKERHRIIVLNVLKNIVGMGHELVLPKSACNKERIDSSDSLLAFLNHNTVNLEQLRRIWVRHNQDVWRSDPQLYRILASQILSQAEPLLAYDITQEGLEFFPEDVRLRQLHALCLIRVGLWEKANEILLRLYNEGHKNEETLGLLAGTYKEMAINAKGEDERQRHRMLAIKYYQEAYMNFHGVWSGINLATLDALFGDLQAAKKIAQEICSLNRETLLQVSKDGYWMYASLGEACVILGLYDEALDHYRQAMMLAKGRLGDIVSTRKNVRLLGQTLKVEESFWLRLEALFDIPKVIVFSGHMIDRTETFKARFPSCLETQVRCELEQRIDKIGHCISYSSAACGSDILFLEIMLERQFKVNLVLPCEVEQFIKTSVDYIKGSNWRQRFEKILSLGVHSLEVSQHTSKFMDIPFDYANHILYGFALINARHMQTELIPMAVWDRDSEKKIGGTTGVVENWLNRGHQVEIIDLKSMVKDVSSSVENDTPLGLDLKDSTNKKYKSEVMGLLFADTVGYSTLSDDEMIIFGEKLLFLVQELFERGSYQVSSRNSWGDALFLAFSRIDHAGLFALDFVQAIGQIDWKKEGLSRDIKLRTALHAGLVYKYQNPISDTSTYNGANVCRVARMEAITPPGQVFCSQEFAALAEAYHIKDFTCHYVGQISMPKQFGTYPTYHVRRN